MHAVAELASAVYFALSESPNDSAATFYHQAVASSLAQAAVNAVGGTVLIRLREPLSRWLFPGDSTIALPAETDLVGALLAVLGVYFVVTAIMDAVPAEVVHWLTARLEADIPDYLRGDTRDTLAVLQSRIWGGTRLAVGVALFVGSGSLARAWHSLRTAGQNR
jgi:hypothetical protein